MLSYVIIALTPIVHMKEKIKMLWKIQFSSA